MTESSDTQELSEWTTAVAQELGLEDALDSSATVEMVLEMTANVSEGVSREAALVTAFLIGAASGRAADPAVAARDYAGKAARLAEGWDADSERGVPANDQSRRA